MKPDTRFSKFARLWTFAAFAFSILVVTLLFNGPLSAQNSTHLPAQAAAQAETHAADHFDVSPPLRNVVPTPPQPGAPRMMEEERLPKGHNKKTVAPSAPIEDAVLQTGSQPLVAGLLNMSAEGLGMGGSVLDCARTLGFAIAPPDDNLAVGDTQVVQWVNLCYAVFDKATGAAIGGPLPGNHFWKGFGGPCETQDSGDIIILYDKVAHRWFASQNTFKAPYMTCVAVSTSEDAMGSYYRYAFAQSHGLPDYPKWGIWRDGYYQHNNVFGGTNGFASEACAYDRAKMLVGNSTARQICFLAPTMFDDSLLPADIDSPNMLPPSGEPEMYLGSIDNAPRSSVIYEYLFHANFTTPSLSTFRGFGGTMPVSVPQFELSCNGVGSADCIPQRGISTKLASMGDRLMYRLAYRNFGSHQAWVAVHDVTTPSGHVGERWYEFRASETSTRPSVYQSGTYAGPAGDTNNRWMGSIAMDEIGDIALVYSVSSASTYPSIRYTGRRASDPLGTMGGEVNILTGGGSQTLTNSRWGDYTSIALDPAGCTLWYTNEYYVATSSYNWRTRLGSIKFPSCP